MQLLVSPSGGVIAQFMSTIILALVGLLKMHKLLWRSGWMLRFWPWAAVIRTIKCMLKYCTKQTIINCNEISKKNKQYSHLPNDYFINFACHLLKAKISDRWRNVKRKMNGTDQWPSIGLRMTALANVNVPANIVIMFLFICYSLSKLTTKLASSSELPRN